MDVNNIRDRLQNAPLLFLSVASSSTLLPNFGRDWQSLRQDIDQASQQSLLSDDDISLVCSTATLLATLSQSLLEVDAEVVKQTDSLMDEVQDVLAQLTISDAASPSSTSYRHGSRSSSGVAPSYLSFAYSWILQNLHNPYPSSEAKERIARDAGRPVRVITDWFKDVRRCIGWVALCKNHFQGSRARAVQAAKHVYLHTNTTTQLSPDIVSQFEAIGTRLRDMYHLGDDSGDLSDSSDDSFTPSALSTWIYTSSQSSYARSRSSSSTPSLVFSTDDEDSHSLASFNLDDAPVSLGKRKNHTEEDEWRSLKRNKSGFLNVANGMVKDVTLAAPTALSSTIPDSPRPAQHTPFRKRRLSIAATEREFTSSTPSALSPTCDPRSPLRIPKRRLSVSDLQPASKRPCLPPAVGPRKQAVSAPIPIAYQSTSSVDDWFRTFELPGTPLSVELFNWDVVVENDAFLYNSLFDGNFQSNVTSLSGTYQSPTPLDLVVDPSVLDISSAFTESPPPQLTAPISILSPEPITATTTPAFDIDAFLSIVNAESIEPQNTRSSSSPSTGLSLNDSLDLFGDL